MGILSIIIHLLSIFDPRSISNFTPEDQVVVSELATVVGLIWLVWWFVGLIRVYQGIEGDWLQLDLGFGLVRLETLKAVFA